MTEPLLSIISVGPLVVEVHPDAGMRVEGEDYWLWGDTNARIQGGGVLIEGRTVEYIADALRRAYPEGDPRWHRPMPEPFWEKNND